jgi:iron complex transport system permease protein
MHFQAARPYWICGLALVLMMVLSVAVGSVWIPLPTLAGLFRARLGGATIPAEWQPFETIVFSLRLPRTVLIAMAGAALGGSGAAYQGLFRNPLADPYLIGVASGAGLGAVLAMSLRTAYTPLGLMIVPLAAFVGALLTVSIVYKLAKVGNALPTTNLILSGVAVSSFATNLTSFWMIHSSGEVRRALAWLLGGAVSTSWEPVLASLPYIVVGCGILVALSYPLNVLQFGDEQAQQLGLNTNRIRRWIIVAATLSTAAAISFAGIIGFVGLIVPHVVRMLWGSDYRRLVPLALLVGAAFLLSADILARVALAPEEIPTGIITALAGAPFFLWILRRSKKQYFW